MKNITELEGVFLRGSALGSREVSGVGKDGKPYRMTRARILAGDVVVEVTVRPGMNIPPRGQVVFCRISRLVPREGVMSAWLEEVLV